MSVDFTFAQTGPIQPLNTIMTHIESKLESLGFRRSFDVYKVELDSRGVFEECKEHAIQGKKFSDSTDDLQDWQGLSVEFHNMEYTAYFLICNHDNRFLSTYIDVTGRVINELIANNKIDSFIRLIGIVATCIKSQGGFGTFELPFEPVPPEKVIPYIFSNPEGVTSLLGIIPRSVVDKAKVLHMANSEFSIHNSLLDYYLLEHKDFRM